MTRSRQRASGLRTFHEAPGAASRLVCFPHAGGFASYFHPLSRALTPAVELRAAQYPGRLDRSEEPPVETIGGLADEAAAAIAQLPPLPLTLFGHSMGALVAFETAKRLEGHAIQPVRLVASGMQAPSRPPRPRNWEREDVLIEEMGLLAGTDPALIDDPEIRALFLPILTSDFRAVSAYPADQGTVLPCPITVFAGEDDPVVPEGMDQWAAHTSAGFTSYSFAGGHFYLDGFPSEVRAAIRDAAT